MKEEELYLVISQRIYINKKEETRHWSIGGVILVLVVKDNMGVEELLVEGGAFRQNIMGKKERERERGKLINSE